VLPPAPTPPDPANSPAESADTTKGASRTGQGAPESSLHSSQPVLPVCPEPPPQSASSNLDVDQLQAVREPTWWHPYRHAIISSLASGVVHATLLIVMVLLVESRPMGFPGWTLTATMEEPTPLETLLEESPAEKLDPMEALAEGAFQADAVEAEANDVAMLVDGAVQPAETPPDLIGLEASLPREWFQPTDAPVGGGFDGRDPQARAASLARRGGTPDSEAAVARGLGWLAAHQGKNGAWQFNLKNCGCNGYCRNPGNVPTTTGSTGLALLAFLGANHTHMVGQHREVVRKGLYYLAQRAIVSSDGADLTDRDAPRAMYGHGLAAIAICEAYGMTDDPGLKDLAQQALNFIVYAQEKKGGGWRYQPGQPGDTSVFGWQMMALKSGQMARLQFPSPTLFLAQRFLDSVALDEQAQYSYLPAQKSGQTTTAIGLLCRMYTGWPREHPALARGVRHLVRWGPSKDDMYYNYYASQVIFHWGGSDWVRWNRKLRDELIRTQATQGHESGSWYFGCQYSQQAGRLYDTALATLILEVYYRHLPLYGDAVFEQ
jgi:hypothetical protein